MRVLIVGGTRFIGPHVVHALAAQGHEVTVFHRGHHAVELPPSVRHIHDPSAALPVVEYPDSVRRLPVDVVLHMTPVGEQDAQALMRAFTGRARRVVAISSGDVYRAYGVFLGIESGPPDPVPLGEEAPLRRALFPYRASAGGPTDRAHHYEKILVERAVLGEQELPGTVLRLGAVFGPGDAHRRLWSSLRRMDDRRPAILLDARQAGWRWTHAYVEDVAQAIVLAVVDERAASRVYNVGEAVTPTVAERVAMLADVAAWAGRIVPLPAERLPAALRDGRDYGQELVLDTTRIRRELGYRESVPPLEALRRTVVWERANPPATDPIPVEYASEDAALAAAGALTP